MIGKVMAALIGAEVEKRRQDSGLKGAVLGLAVLGLTKRVLPAALLLGGAYAAKKLYDHRRELDQPLPISS
jgi:hypothetical protein